MKIRTVEFAEGARSATGITVIIDVFRAFSVGCYAFDAGAARIIATGSVEEAYVLKKKYLNSILVGERDERKITGFDFGNSPTEIIKADIAGKTIIHTTTAGTQGLVNATDADEVLACSLVNAAAVAKYIKARNPKEVTLVAMGYRAVQSADEDILCADIISSLLRDEEHDFSQRVESLRHTSGKRFFDPANIDFSPPTDFFLCTMVNKFDFVLKATRRHDKNIDLSMVEM